MKMDAGKEEAVWRRVRGEMPRIAEDLQGLILEEQTGMSTYLQLSRQMQSREMAVKCQQLFRQEQAHLACLKGIYTLIKGEKPNLRPVQPEEQRTELTLRKCYGRQMRMLMEYEKRTSDPEYGPVFARLADQEREHCRMVLELIGQQQN